MTSSEWTDRLPQGIGRQLSANRHLAKGAVAIMMATLIASAAGWVYWVVGAHRWRTAEIGASLSLVAALSIIGLVAGQPVTTTLLVRLGRAKRPAAVLVRTLFMTSIAGFGLGLVALLVVPHSLTGTATVPVRVMFLLSALVAPTSIVLDGAVLVVRRSGLIVYRTLVHSLGKLALLGVLALPALFVGGPFAVLVSWTVAQVVASGIVLLRSHRSFGERGEEGLETSSDAIVLRGFVPQVIGSLSASLPPQILPLVVVASLGTRSAAWFSITWLVGGLCFMISPAVAQTLLAEGSRADQDLRTSVRAAAALSLALLAVPLLLYVLAGREVLNLFGANYGRMGGGLLLALAVSSLPDLVTNLGVTVYRIHDSLIHAAVTNVVIATVAITGTIVAVDHHNLAGIGWSWCAAQSCGVVVILVVAALDRQRHRRSVG